MTSTLRSARVRLNVLAAALALLVGAALPATAPAASLTGGGLTWDLRDSWYGYITNPLWNGRVITGGGASQSGDLITFSFGTGSSYDLVDDETGDGTIVYDGDLSFVMPAHYIDVDISDPQVEIAEVEDDAAVVTAVVSYDPLESGTQVANPTTPTRIDLLTVDLGGTFTGDVDLHDWADAPARLTADGARAFNGGGNGAYRTGESFGSVSFWGES